MTVSVDPHDERLSVTLRSRVPELEVRCSEEESDGALAANVVLELLADLVMEMEEGHDSDGVDRCLDALDEALQDPDVAELVAYAFFDSLPPPLTESIAPRLSQACFQVLSDLERGVL